MARRSTWAWSATHTWTGLTPGSSYLFSVAAKNAIGTGTAATQSVTLPAAPGAPTGLSLESSTDGRTLTLRWSPPASDGGSPVTGYAVTRLGGPAIGVSAGDRELRPGRPGPRHDVHLLGAGHQRRRPGPGATVSATTHTVPGAPNAPTVKKGRKGGSATATVGWAPPASTGGLTISGYQVAGLPDPATAGRGPAKASAVLTGTTYKFKGKAGKYRFAVVAINAAGPSAVGPLSRQTKVQ